MLLAKVQTLLGKAPVSLGRLWSCALGGATDAESGLGMTTKSDADASEIRFRQVSLAPGLSPLSLCLSLLCE